MNTYTWTHTGRTGARTWQDPARNLSARIVRAADGRWSWSVAHLGLVVAAGHTRYLVDAKVDAGRWIGRAAR